MGTDRLDRWTRVLMVLTILAVAVFAFVQSYTHLYVLGWTHHQYGTANRMFPLSVDWVMFAAGLAMLHLGRKGIRHPLPRSALTLGATATLVANIASGIIWGWESALIASWAPIALFTVVELGMLLVRTAHAKPEANEAKEAKHEERGVGAPVLVPAVDRPDLAGAYPVGQQAIPVEAVTGPGDPIQGWGQLGRQDAGLNPGLTGIGLRNGRE